MSIRKWLSSLLIACFFFPLAQARIDRGEEEIIKKANETFKGISPQFQQRLLFDGHKVTVKLDKIYVVKDGQKNVPVGRFLVTNGETYRTVIVNLPLIGGNEGAEALTNNRQFVRKYNEGLKIQLNFSANLFEGVDTLRQLEKSLNANQSDLETRLKTLKNGQSPKFSYLVELHLNLESTARESLKQVGFIQDVDGNLISPMDFSKLPGMDLTDIKVIETLLELVQKGHTGTKKAMFSNPNNFEQLGGKFQYLEIAMKNLKAMIELQRSIDLPMEQRVAEEISLLQKHINLYNASSKTTLSQVFRAIEGDAHSKSILVMLISLGETCTKLHLQGVVGVRQGMLIGHAAELALLNLELEEIAKNGKEPVKGRGINGINSRASEIAILNQAQLHKVHAEITRTKAGSVTMNLTEEVKFELRMLVEQVNESIKIRTESEIVMKRIRGK